MAGQSETIFYNYYKRRETSLALRISHFLLPLRGVATVVLTTLIQEIPYTYQERKMLPT